MDSESEEEIDLVLSKFISLFECNLLENVDDHKLTEQKEIKQNIYSCNLSSENISESNLENVKDIRPKDVIGSVVITNSENHVNPLINKSNEIDKTLNISITEHFDGKRNEDIKTQQIEKINVVLEKSEHISIFENNLPILCEETNESNQKHLKVFIKYGGKDNIFIETDKVLDLPSNNFEFNNCMGTQLEKSIELEKSKCKEDKQHGIEFKTKISSNVNKSVNKTEKNNNITINKSYLTAQYSDNSKNIIEKKSRTHKNECLPWTIELRPRRKYLNKELNVNSNHHDSKCKEAFEFEDDDDKEWLPDTENERKDGNSVLLSEKSLSSSSSFIIPVASETHKKRRNKRKTSVSLSKESSTSRKARGSKENSRSSSRKEGTIHYCHHPGCYMYFNRPNKLQIHERTHTGERPFVCSVKDCGSSYLRQQHLQRHMIRSHKQENLTPGESCEKCGKHFADIYSLQKHITRYHVRREYACESCDKVFKKHQHLRSHSYLHTGIQPYECQYPGCGMRFINPSKLKRHSRIHETGRYECSYETDGVVCGEKFDRYHDLRLHLSYNHPKECDICGKHFKQKRSLRLHRSTHENVREAFFCPVPDCDKLYYSNKNLTAHIRMSHEKAYIFECGECKSMLSTKQKLANHMKIHDVGYQRDWSRSKPIKPRKDKGVSKTDISKLLSGYDDDDDGSSESELEDMEIEDQKEKRDNKESPNWKSSNGYEKSNLDNVKLKQRNKEHIEEMEYMEIDDKTQSVDVSEISNILEISVPTSRGSKCRMNNEYFPNSSQFTLLSGNDHDKKNNSVSNTTDCKVIGCNDINKCNHGKIITLVQGKTSSVSVKMKLG